MTNEAIYDAITNISDGLIEEAETHSFRRKSFFRRFAPVAAALALVVGLGAVVTGNLRVPGFGAGAGGGGNGGGADGYSYMHYVGPVLPLTATDDAEGVTAARHVDYDFSPYKTRQESYDYDGETQTYDAWNSEAIVTDAYTLTNTTGEDRTLTLLYPIVSPLGGLQRFAPTVTVDGAVVETERFGGPYTGGFAPAVGSNAVGERLNLDSISSWEGYQALLEDGSYQDAALAPLPDVDGIPVVVYRLSDYQVEPTDAANPTLQFSCTVDPARTKIMTYHANGWERKASGYCACHIGGLDNPASKPMYVVLMGDDVDGYTLQGYRDGGCDKGEELNITASVLRYETSLGEVLRMIIRDREETDLAVETEFPQAVAALSDEEIYGYMADYLLRYGVLSDDPADRYAWGELEELREAFGVERVIYFRFAATVPAHGSAEVTATMRKDGSYDFYGKKRGVEGYDLATRLGSTLPFTKQRASVSNTGEITLIDNNFGFDPEGGIVETALDQSIGHYWMQVAKKTISP